MPETIIPNTQNDVVNTVAHLLHAFEQSVLEKLDAKKTGLVYDQGLSYETGLKTFLTKENSNWRAEESPPCLFLYNRIISEDTQYGMASRVKNHIGKYVNPKDPTEIFTYKAQTSEFDINFLYIAHQIQDMYNFETAYNNMTSISDTIELEVDIPILGKFKYYLSYLPLTDVQSNSGTNDVHYSSVAGIIRVRGTFFTFTGSKKAVAKINLRIFDNTNPQPDPVLLEQFEIPPTP